MKTKKHQLTLIALFLACFTIKASAQDLTAIETQIKKINRELAEKIIAGEFSSEHYADDVISMPNNAPLVEGIDAIRASYEQMKSSGMKFESFNTTPVKIMLNGNMVTEIGTYSLSMMVPNVPSPIKDKGKYITLWEVQDDGSLKIKVETWNTDMMPQQ